MLMLSSKLQKFTSLNNANIISVLNTKNTIKYRDLCISYKQLQYKVGYVDTLKKQRERERETCKRSKKNAGLTFPQIFLQSSYPV